MKCPICGQSLPEDSAFCQYCGNDIKKFVSAYEENGEKPLIQRPDDLQPIPRNTEELTSSQHETSSLQMNRDNGSEKTEEAKERSKNLQVLQNPQKRLSKRKLISLILASVFLMAMIATIVVLIIQHFNDQALLREKELSIQQLNKNISSLTQTVAEKDKTISEKDRTNRQQESVIQSNNSTISELNEKIAKLTPKAEKYNTLVSALKSGTIGYAASNFNVQPCIVCVSTGATKKVYLTANWSSGGTVTSIRDTSAAQMSFDSNNWSTGTTLTITGNSSGITVFTFSNSVDSKTFKLIVIVD